MLYRLLLFNFVLLSKGFGVDVASATVRQRIFKKKSPLCGNLPAILFLGQESPPYLSSEVFLGSRSFVCVCMFVQVSCILFFKWKEARSIFF